MAKIIAAITMSVDGYITGPDDGPGQGLAEGGERLRLQLQVAIPEGSNCGGGECAGPENLLERCRLERRRVR